MGIANVINVTGSAGGGEIIRELINSSDGQGLHFDGTGQVTATALTLPAPYSFEVVLKTETDVTTGQILIGNASASSARRALELNSGEIRFSYYNGSSWLSVSGGSIEADKVYHIVATRDSSDVQKIYINGNDSTTGTNAVSTFGTSGLSLGYSSNASYPHRLNGSLYRARIYNKALTQAEVDNAYQRADVDFADQYGSQTSKLLNGTAWTGASGTTKPNSWVIGSQPTFTIDSSSGSGAEPALKIARNSDNPYIYQTFTATVGVDYRVKYRVKNIDATHVRVGIGSSAIGTQYNVTDYTAASWASFEQTFTATTTTFSVYAQVSTTTGTQAGYIDSFLVEQIGCVSDLDLAFSNPTQSLMVQDRAGVADGTASSGVSQTQKIVQLNATAISVSAATARTVSDGHIVADRLGAGIVPSYAVDVFTSGNNGIRTNNGTAQLYMGSTAGVAAVGTLNDNTLNLISNGGVRMSIDSAGLITAGNQIKVTSSNAGEVAFSVGDAGTGFYNTGSNSIGLATNGVQRINVNNGGEIIVNDSTGTEAGRITTIGNNLTISGTVVNHCGFSFATNAILPATQSATNNNTVDLGANGNNFKDFWLAGEAKLAGFTTLGGFNDLTIASGAVTATSSTHNIDTEGGGATDYLDTINGGSTGSIITLMAASGSRTVVVEDGTNLKLAGDCTLDNAEDTITLIKSGSAWHEVSRSNNGA